MEAGWPQHQTQPRQVRHQMKDQKLCFIKPIKSLHANLIWWCLSGMEHKKFVKPHERLLMCIYVNVQCPLFLRWLEWKLPQYISQHIIPDFAGHKLVWLFVSNWYWRLGNLLFMQNKNWWAIICWMILGYIGQCIWNHYK